MYDNMWLQILIYFCLLLCVDIYGRRTKIIGGEDAEIMEFPYIVSIRYYKENQHFCGGSIISEWHILTAAHCLFYIQDEYDNVKIYAGISNSRRIGGQRFDINYTMIHPQFVGIKSKEAMDHHDIAIITLKTQIYFNKYQQKIDLPTSNIVENTMAMIVGWGQKLYGASTSDQLQKSCMRIYNNSLCSKYVPFELKNEQFCAFHSRGVGACTGDSGSPLTVNRVIFGIISFTAPCAQGFPDIYTNVYSYLSFIKNYIQDND